MLVWGYSTYTSSKFTVDVFLAKCFLPFSHAINTSNTGKNTSNILIHMSKIHLTLAFTHPYVFNYMS